MPKHKLLIKCFNTDLCITLDETRYLKSINETINSVAKTLHNSFNIYDEQSEISKLNTQKKIVPSAHLRDILQTAIKYEKLTNLHFNTNQSFEEYNNIEFTNQYVHIKHKIDLGGIAKGYFMLLIKNFLENKNTNYKIDFGGALLFEKGDQIKLRDIQNHMNYILEFTLAPLECIHTSSFYWQSSNSASHIHQKEIGYLKVNKSVSVIDENPILCDTLSTAIYSMDFDYAISFVKKLKLKVIYILNNDIYISSSLKGYKLLQNHSKVNIIYL